MPDALERIRQLPRGAVVLIIGGTDQGKTTFTAMAARTLAEEELRVAVVDSDIGQSEIGPPATVGVAWAKEDVAKLTELKPAGLFFVGAFNATSLPLEHVTATVNAVRHARERDAERILVDTTGYISGPSARRLKAAKAAQIRPALILAFGGDTHAETLAVARAAAATCGAEVLTVPVAEMVQKKPTAMRTTRRQTRLAAYFGDRLETVTLPMEQATTLGATLGTGAPIANHLAKWAGETLHIDVAFGEISGETLTLFVNGVVPSGWERLSGAVADYFQVKSVRAISLDNYAGVLVGLQEETGRLLSLGRSAGFDSEQVGIRIEVPENAATMVREHTRLVVFGRVRLASEGAVATEIKPGEL